MGGERETEITADSGEAPGSAQVEARVDDADPSLCKKADFRLSTSWPGMQLCQCRAGTMTTVDVGAALRRVRLAKSRCQLTTPQSQTQHSMPAF